MKEHPIYKGYLISEDGKVFSCLQRNGRNPAKIDYSNPKELRYHTDKDGYLCTSVQYQCKSKNSLRTQISRRNLYKKIFNQFASKSHR